MWCLQSPAHETQTKICHCHKLRIHSLLLVNRGHLLLICSLFFVKSWSQIKNPFPQVIYSFPCFSKSWPCWTNLFPCVDLTKSREWITTTWPRFSKSREHIIMLCTQFQTCPLLVVSLYCCLLHPDLECPDLTLALLWFFMFFLVWLITKEYVVKELCVYWCTSSSKSNRDMCLEPKPVYAQPGQPDVDLPVSPSDAPVPSVAHDDSILRSVLLHNLYSCHIPTCPF